MATTTAKNSQRDRHATPVVVTKAGTVIAGKRRIEAHLKKHGAASVAIHEFHHYAMLPFLRVARDEDGKLHLCTESSTDTEGWDLIA